MEPTGFGLPVWSQRITATESEQAGSPGALTGPWHVDLTSRPQGDAHAQPRFWDQTAWIQTLDWSQGLLCDSESYPTSEFWFPLL